MAAVKLFKMAAVRQYKMTTVKQYKMTVSKRKRRKRRVKSEFVTEFQLYLYDIK